MNDDFHDSPAFIDDQPGPFWTRQRILYAIIVISVIIAMLAWLIWPYLNLLFQPPRPMSPPLTPLPRI